jgi:hypothetical protein
MSYLHQKVLDPRLTSMHGFCRASMQLANNYQLGESVNFPELRFTTPTRVFTNAVDITIRTFEVRLPNTEDSLNPSK